MADAHTTEMRDKMKLPESVKIGIHRYSIRVGHEMDGWGHVSHNDKVITISDNMVESEKANTLLEEIGHTCFQMTGVSRLKEMPDNWQDVCLGSLCDWLLHVLRENPGVTEYLLKAGEGKTALEKVMA